MILIVYIFLASRLLQLRFAEQSANFWCQPPRIVVEVSDTSESLTSNWQLALFELDGSHYAAVCVESDKSAGGGYFSFFSFLNKLSNSFFSLLYRCDC